MIQITSPTLFFEWESISMPGLEQDPKVGRSFQLRKSLDKALDHLKVEVERDKTDLINEAIALYVHSKTLPVLGRVRGGDPLLATSETEDYLTLPAGVAKGADFVLAVQGDSMAPTICEGDLVAVRKQNHAQKGDIVVAYILPEGDDEPAGEDLEGVVKRVVRDGTIDFLASDNPAPEHRERYSPARYRIIGKVVTTIREHE